MGLTHASHRPAPLTATLAISVALHALAGLAVVAAPSASDTPQLDLPQPDEQRESNPLELGILESRAVTIDWLGMADPTPHDAEQSTTNQAQLSPNPAPETQPQTAAPPPAPEPTPPAEPQPDAQPDPIPPLPARSVSDGPRPTPEVEPTPNPTPPTPPAPEPTPPVIPTPPTPPAPTPDAPSEADAPAPSPDGAPGLADPRESDAASREPPPEVRSNGAPIAREGMLIQTARPRWSISTRILAAVRNPTVEVTFGPDGRVRRVDFAKDEEGRDLTAGDSRVSQPLLDAIYRWRAEGPKIDALTPATDATPETTHTITLTIILRG